MRKVLTLTCLILMVAGLSIATVEARPAPAQQGSVPTLAAETTGNLIWNIDNPTYQATVAGIVVIEGWVLSEVGVSRIDLYIDGDYISSANINIPRDDVIEHYPLYADTPSAHPGFTLGFVASDYTNGWHRLNMVVTDSNDHAETIGDRSVKVDNTINPAPRGYLDTPLPQDFVTGPFPVYGWALDENGIDRIEVMVDGLVVQEAIHGGPRQDIYHALPMYPYAAQSGLIAFIDSTRFENGSHLVTVRAYDTLGQSRDIGQRPVTVSNQPINAPPFGIIEWPLRDVMMEGQCDDACGGVGPSGDPSCWHPLNFVQGWALDTGARGEQGGVAFVELLVDGALFFNTRRDCYYDNILKSYVHCYGLPRWDVQEVYPGYTNSPEAGWKFWLDIGYLINHMGYVEGAHYLSVRAGDTEDTVTTIDTIPVYFKCVYGHLTNERLAALGYIDMPDAYEYVSGVIRTSGWAIDYNYVAIVRIYVDGVYQGDAIYGGERLDVWYAIEKSNIGLYSGWYFDLDTTQFTDGEHDLVVEVVDGFGDLRILGERRFISDNNPSNP